MSKVYTLAPETPTYRWECGDSMEEDWVGDTYEGEDALRLTRQYARQHTEGTGHETLVWKILTSYLPIHPPTEGDTE